MTGNELNITRLSKYNEEKDVLNENIVGTTFAIGVFALGVGLSLLNGDAVLKCVFAAIPGISGFYAVKGLIRLIKEKSQLPPAPSLNQTTIDNGHMRN